MSHRWIRRRTRLAGVLGFVLVATAGASALGAEQAPEPVCIDDEVGDTAIHERPTATDEPAADLVRLCARFGRSLEFELVVREATDPRTNAAWTGATVLGWFVDTDGDGRADFFIDYAVDADQKLVATVIDLRDPAQPVRCQPDASFTGHYLVSGLSPDCLDRPTSIAVSAGMILDDGQTRHLDVIGDGDFGALVSQESTTRVSHRLAGGDRFATSVAISVEQFPVGAEVAYLARSDVFADAVAGGSLTDGPLLLVPRCGLLPAAIAAELKRLQPTRVVALGGKGAVCDEVLSAAGEAAGVNASSRTRLFGADRHATSVAISRSAFPDGATTVHLARSDAFADAAAGGALVDGPVLLVGSEGPVSADVLEEISRLDPIRVVALGGPAAVADEVLAAAGAGRQTSRLAGGSRLETAIAISRSVFAQGAPTVFLARADDLADALSAGTLTNGPLLLVDTCGPLAPAVLDEIERLRPNRVVAVGGERAVCSEVLAAAAGSSLG